MILLHSNAGMVMSDLEGDVLDELDRGLKFLRGSPQLVPEVSPRWPQACSFECDSFAECVLGVRTPVSHGHSCV